MTDPRTALKALRTYYATLTPHEYFEHLKRANPGLDLGNAQDVPERTMAVMLRVAEARRDGCPCGVSSHGSGSYKSGNQT